MPDLPTGTVSFLFTDIEGSTALLQHLGDRRYADVLAEQRRLLRAAFHEGGAHEVDTQGDAFFVAFGRARDAMATAASAQRAITAHPWPEGAPVRVCMGLHTGEATIVASRYVGLNVHRAARICAAGWGGQILVSQATRDAVAHDLPPGVSLRDLGEHRLKDLQRREQIFQLLLPDLPADFPPLRSLDTLPNNLPHYLTSFIGREREMAEVKRLLATTHLLTLTGPGGCGKTRLALQVAADLLEEFASGVWLVELAALSDPALVPQVVASALGVREEPDRPLLATLSDYLQPKRLLLVLDNCEHLIGACTHLAAALLQGCPNVKILALSWEVLGIPGEATYHVPTLSLPDLRRLPSLEHLTQYESVRLFIERATDALPTFTLTNQNALAVAQVCHRLDGIPLAIELAAARVKVLSVERIAERVDDRFRLLTSGSRTALPRQQTLRATIDWGYDLLSEKERTLLRRLSVFVGGWTLEAAEAVCTWDGVEEPDVLDLLTHLADKSLVVMEEQDGTVRYRLLETVRQYGREKLLAAEADVARGRHREWCLGLAERAEPELQGPNQDVWLERLETELDNLRQALEWSKGEAGGRDEGGAEAGLRLAGALLWFWYLRGYLSQGLQWLQGMLSGSSETSTSARAKALNGAGFLAWRQGEHGRAAALVEEGLALYRQLGDGLGIAFSLNILGLVARRQGDYGRAKELLEESLALWRESGHEWGIALSLNTLGVMARQQGDYGRAMALGEESLALYRQLGDKGRIASSLSSLGLVAQEQGDDGLAVARYEEGLRIRRELGDRRGIAESLNNLGLVVWTRGDHAAARSVFEESLGIRRELGERRGIASSLGNLGLVSWNQGDYAAARSLYEESLRIRRELGERRGITSLLESFAILASTQGQAGRAAVLFGAADALRDVISVPRPPTDRARYESALAAARAALVETAFAAAWAEGRVMTLEQAIAYALETPAHG